MDKIALTWSGLTKLEQVTIDLINSATPGVYRLSYRHEDKNIYVFFVGQGPDVKNALQNHLSKKETNVCIKNYISLKECFFKYAPVELEKTRALVYKQICKFYQPSCNEDKILSDEDFITLNVN